MRLTILFAMAVFIVDAQPAGAAFHLMQIERVIAGVGGDTSAQAIQLRMRSSFQNLVSLSQIRAWDANGANPVTIIAFPGDVVNHGCGKRILITTLTFNTNTLPTAVPDFLMQNVIPASYLPAGSLTFESNLGTIYWRLSWGNGGYSGSNAGSLSNDDDGDFGPPWPNALPSTNDRALRFSAGGCNVKSTTNAADYSLTINPAVFRNNNGMTFTVQLAGDCVLNCPAQDGGVITAGAGPSDKSSDLNGDGVVGLVDLSLFALAFPPNPYDFCADYNCDGVIDLVDLSIFALHYTHQGAQFGFCQ